MLQVYYRPEKQKPPRKGDLWLDNTKLRPGRNDVPNEMADTWYWQKYIDQGVLEVCEEIITPVEKTDYSGMNVDEAEPLIEKEMSLDVLRAIRNNDTRKGIHQAVDRQIRFLEDRM